MASKSLQWLALAMLLAAVAIALAADPSREETAANASGYGLKGNYGKNYYNEDSYDSPYPSGGKGNVCHCGDNKCEVQIPPCKDGCAAAGVGLTECKGECVVLPNNNCCGADGDAPTCEGGKVCGTVDNKPACVCPTGFTDCDGECKNLDASTTCGIVVSPVDGATQCLVTDCTQLGLVCENNECVCPSPLTRPCTDAGGTTFCFPGPECPSCAAPVCPPAGEEPGPNNPKACGDESSCVVCSGSTPDCRNGLCVGCKLGGATCADDEDCCSCKCQTTGQGKKCNGSVPNGCTNPGNTRTPFGKVGKKGKKV